MQGHLFIAPGDITQLAADAIAYSTSLYFGHSGNLYPSFVEHVPGFAEAYGSLTTEKRGRAAVGDAFWLGLGGGRPCGVVVVVAAAGSQPSDEQARLAVGAAIDEAVRRLRHDLGRADRLLIALPAFRLGQGGARHERLRSARVQVATAHEALQRHAGVDVAFITYTPALYEIFLEARRLHLGTPPDDGPHVTALERALASGEGVLFVGAGLSRGAGLPDWSGLIARLARELGIADHTHTDYLDLAQWYRERFGGRQLAEIIRETFAEQAGAARPTLAHYLLLGLPVRHVITTNYDDLIERALAALKRYPVKVVRQEDVARTGRGDDVYVVKLHGDAASAAEIVLSRDDYDAFFAQRPALALLLEGLLLNQTFFFVGYGLRDPNFRQIYSRIARMLREARRPAFATTFEAGGDTADYLMQQWRNKQLHLLRIPGETQPEQQQQLLRLLDRVAERVTTANAARLFLAADVQVAPALSRLRHQLVTQVGSEVEQACLEELAAPDLRADISRLASVLAFLAVHGWQPRSVDLCHLWERLAEAAPDDAERRRLLVAALRSAERYDSARRVREQLDRLEQHPEVGREDAEA